MRNLFFAFLILPFCCFSQIKSTPIVKAKAGVKKYLSETLNDLSSYQPSEWSGFEKVFTDYEDTNEGSKLLDSVKYWLKAARLFTNKLAELKLSLGDSYGTDTTVVATIGYATTSLNAAKALNKKIQYNSQHFNRVFRYYLIKHKFRSKNGFGAYILDEYTFTLDKDFKVIQADSLNEYLRKSKELDDELKNFNKNN